MAADEANADAIGDVSQIAGLLHVAAKDGNFSTVQSLLERRTNPDELDAEGRTALQVAEATGSCPEDVIELLREVTTVKPPAAVSSPKKTEPASADKGAKANEQTSQQEIDQLVDEMDKEINDPLPAQASQSQSDFMKTSQSLPALGSYNDLKKKTEFAATTVDGVLKRTTFMSAVSTCQAAPKYTIAVKNGSSFIRANSNPAPGSYNMPREDQSKYKMQPKFSFGGSSRFGLGQSPSKKQPGPGAYNPRDPNVEDAPKVGFGGSTRGKGQPQSCHNPGPGAYEFRAFGSQGKMFTAGGRHPVSYMRARSQPGPGAYNPMLSLAYPNEMKVGFGTSARNDIASSAPGPGPGSYDMQNKKSLGDGNKYSISSRRRLHDLNSYVTPGPGSYNSHTTAFGEVP